MRKYIISLKLLQGRGMLRIQASAFSDVPTEALRMLRAQHGIAYALDGETMVFWRIGMGASKAINDLEEFSGKITVGRDSIGYYWEDTE